MAGHFTTRLGVFAIGVWLIFGATASAQTTVSSVSVEGNQRIPDSTVASLTGIAPGAVLSDGEINAALQNVLASGFFETAQVEVRGNTLVFNVAERPTINRINVEGNRRIDDELFLQTITSRPGQVYSPEQAEQDAEIIVGGYLAQARLAATVEPKIIRRSDNRVDLVFEVTEARVVENEAISFVGNRAYSDRRLRRVIDSKQAGLFRTFVGRDTFVPERVQFDRQLLTDFYQARGYVDFTVLDVTTELSRERDATFIQFTVREGQQFSVGEITISSEFPEVDIQEYRDAVRLSSGEIWNPLRIDEQIARIEQLALQQELEFLRAEPRVTRNERDLTLDVEFALVRGPRVFVERIDIEGNQTTLDRVIRQRFDVVEGDPFNPRQIQNTADRLRAIGYFETVAVDTREGSSSNQVIVDVDVTEQPTGNLTLGGSFSTDDGIGLVIGFSERNFLGRGQSFSADIQTTAEDESFRLSFAEPYFLGRDLRLSLSGGLVSTDFDDATYQTREIFFRPSLRFPVSENGRLSVFYEITEQELSNVDDGASEIIKNEAGEALRSAIGYEYTLNLIRGGLNPNRGFLLGFEQEFAGVGGEVEFLKTVARVVGQRDILNEEAELRAIIEGGILTPLGGQDSRIGDRFFLGSRQLRGFSSRGAGPRDLAAGIQDVLGGNKYFSARFEAQFPLGLPEEYGISGGVFADFASLWDLDDLVNTPGTDIDDSFELRSSVGVSIFWDTPIGPLRLNFSEAVLSNPLDETNSFDITISTSF